MKSPPFPLVFAVVCAVVVCWVPLAFLVASPLLPEVEPEPDEDESVEPDLVESVEPDEESVEPDEDESVEPESSESTLLSC